MVLLSITPLLDGVLRLDIIAPFHTSGPPLLQFHLAIEQWGIKTEPYGLVTFSISFQTCFGVITHFNSDPTNYAETSSVTNFSNTDFYVVFYFNNSGSNAAGSQVFWVAIGNS